MYSNAQEIQVDSRHYKETGSLEPCRGFLHVHFYEGKDLPQQKGKASESFAKWYVIVWYGMLWYGMVWYGMVWYGMV